MSVLASADEYGKCLYNGEEFPDIDSVWTDKETYPYAYIVKKVYPDEAVTLIVTDKVAYFASSAHKQINIGGNLRNYGLTDGSWVLREEANKTYGFSLVTNTSRYTFVWTNTDILYTDGTVFLAASGPVATSPTTPVFASDLNGQTINMDLGGTLTFYVLVGNCNGTPSCEWYINGNAYDAVFDFVALENANYDYIQAWSYTPGEAGTRILRCDVTNTYGEASETVTAGYVTVVVGGDTSGDGSGSVTDTEIIGALDIIETDMAVLQASIDSVSEQVGAVQDAVEELPDRIISGGTDPGSEELNSNIQSGVEDMENAMDDVGQVTLPSEDIGTSIEDLVDDESSSAVSEFLGRLTGNALVTTQFAIACVLTYASYLLFGKKK